MFLQLVVDPGLLHQSVVIVFPLRTVFCLSSSSGIQVIDGGGGMLNFWELIDRSLLVVQKGNDDFDVSVSKNDEHQQARLW